MFPFNPFFGESSEPACHPALPCPAHHVVLLIRVPQLRNAWTVQEPLRRLPRRFQEDAEPWQFMLMAKIQDVVNSA